MTAKSTNPQADQITYVSVDDLLLGGKNPRLGRKRTKNRLDQEEVLSIMEDWTLEELATSFIESGFWPQEALIVVRESAGRTKQRVVVEGNRRLAALKMINRAFSRADTTKFWKSLIRGVPKARLTALQDKIPIIEMADRASVKSYLGFRHVTGIKEWKPAEKAQFIAELIEADGLTYEQVRRRIGSKLPSVRQNYVSYRLLLQMEDESEKVNVEKVEERFSVLYLSLRSDGVRRYLSINVESDPATAKKPVPKKQMKHLENFAKWLFGDAKSEPLFTDSRRVDDFGKILANKTSVSYLERTQNPSFEVAKRMSGVAESEVATHIETAADEVEEALRAAHSHKGSARVRDAVNRLTMDTLQLVKLFPGIEKTLKNELT